MFDWYWVAALAVIVLAFRLVRPLLGFILAPEISAKVMASQPSTIHLEPGDPAEWRDGARLEQVTHDFAALGFAVAGTHVVPELPQVRVRLFANPADSLFGVVYEHPARGLWYEIVCRGTDGSSITWSTLPENGLDARPGHPIRHLPRATVDSLWRTVQREKPAVSLQPASVSNVNEAFVTAWAEYMAWRKQRGISRIEAARVGAKQAA